MSNINPLDSVVRRLENKSDLEAGEVLVMINEKTGEIETKKPSKLSSKLSFKKIRYFAVSTTNVANCTGIYYQLSNSLNLQISYKVSCAIENSRTDESRIVKKLFKIGVKLEDNLNHIISSWVGEFITTQSERTVIHSRYKLKEFIKNQAKRQIGLNLLPIIRFQNEDQLESFPIKSKSFAVRVEDYRGTLQLNYETELELLESQWTQALLNFGELPYLENRIQNKMKFFFMQKTLQEFCFQLDSTLEDELKAELNELVYSSGRYLAYLNLSSPSIVNLIPKENPIKIESKVTCNIANHNQKIAVESLLVLELDNIGTFTNSKIKDLELWLKEKKLPNITQDILWKKTYKEVLLEVDKIKLAIEEKIEKQIENIGYIVKQHTFIPDLPEIIIKDKGFNISFEEEYFTSDSRVPINIQVHAKGIVKDLSLLSDRLLSPKTNILQEIEDTIKDIIEDKIHRIDPQTAFTEFSFNPNGVPIKQALARQITEKICSDFKVSEQSAKVIIKLANSKITDKIEKLTENTHAYQVIVVSKRLDEEYTEKIKFQIRFVLTGVHPEGWHAFQKNRYRSVDDEIDEIKKVLEESTKDALQGIPYEHLLDGDIEIRGYLKSIIEEKVFPITSKYFGLISKLVTITREDTHSETEGYETFKKTIDEREKANRDINEKLHGSDYNRLKTLIDKRDEYIANELYDEANEIEEMINSAKSKSSYARLMDKSKEKEQKRLDSSSHSKFSFKKYGIKTKDNNLLEKPEKDNKED